MHKELSPFLKWYHKNKKEIENDYFHFLKFQSISADPFFKEEVIKCADWVASFLKKGGMETTLWPTCHYPVVFGHKKSRAPKRPTLLLYHHYDVQPVDPLELWENPPFTPTVKEEEVYARGASDNKGQCFYTLTALRAFLQHVESLDFNLKIVIEGEEECGSKGLSTLLKEKKEELQADYLLVVDTDILGVNEPAVTLGVRGMVSMRVECRGSKGDLHSGMLGGFAYNPNRALVELLSKLWDEQGRVTLPGFYDGIKEISAEEKKSLALDFDLEDYKEAFGIKAYGGEKEIPHLERMWLRPTLEINGINGGYTGPGFKTVIPALAVAHLSCRLVLGQDPTKIGKLLKNFLKQHVEKGMELEVLLDHGGDAVMTSPTQEIAQIVKEAYEDVFEKPCKFLMSGGSIPITAELSKAADASPLFIGVALKSDDIHAPNEHFGLDRLEKGFLAMIRIFQKMGALNKS